MIRKHVAGSVNKLHNDDEQNHSEEMRAHDPPDHPAFAERQLVAEIPERRPKQEERSRNDKPVRHLDRPGGGGAGRCCSTLKERHEPRSLQDDGPGQLFPLGRGQAAGVKIIEVFEAIDSFDI